MAYRTLSRTKVPGQAGVHCRGADRLQLEIKISLRRAWLACCPPWIAAGRGSAGCQNAEQLWKEGKVFAWPAWTPCRWFSFVCSHPGSIVEAAGALVDTASRRIGREALASNDDNLAKPSTLGWKLRTRLSCSWRRIRPTTTTIACGVWEDHQDS